MMHRIVWMSFGTYRGMLQGSRTLPSFRFARDSYLAGSVVLLSRAN